MLFSLEEVGSVAAEAYLRCSYSQVHPFMYKADLADCPEEVRDALRSIDRDMALDESHPHAIENWRDL